MRGLARSIAEVERALLLSRQGATCNEIARALSLPRATVYNWLGGQVPTSARRAPTCPRCADGSLDHTAYAYLLGLYLGDGCLVRVGRSMRLEVTLDDRYAAIVVESADAMGAVMPRNAVGLRCRRGSVVVSSYSNHWPCFFPQHGAGRKHLRPIVLVDWQTAIVRAHPRELLRGLIHSDGCRVTNRIMSKGKRYEYTRYMFSNESADILGIFTEACDQVGVEWTQNRRNSISIARRASVALLDTFIGAKT